MNIEKKTKVNFLVKEIGKGNDKAFEELYNLIYKELFNFLRKYTYDIEDIKDVIENTFLVVIQKSKDLLFYQNCYAWIYKIAKYQMFNVNRKIKPEVKLDNINTALLGTVDTFSSISLSFIIDAFPKDLKLIFYLRYNNNYTIKEIAKITNFSISTIKRRISELNSLLKEHFDEKEDGWKWKT